MIARCKLLTLTLLALLMLSMCLSIYAATAQTDQTTLKLLAANTAVNRAFNATLDAEKAGANVTDLLFQLNYAAGILANAENSYQTGDFNKAAIQADSVLPIAQQVTTAAQSAKQNALVSGQNAFWTSIILSIVGVVVFVLVLFWVWRRFKQNYIERLSEAKPEVVNQ